MLHKESLTGVVMTDGSKPADQRSGTNPLFSDRKLKLGMFSLNLSGASTISSMEGVLPNDWSVVRDLTTIADAMEFEAIVPVGRWRGFGGTTDFNGSGFECFTFAAAVAAGTKRPALFATSHVPSIHPVMAAKQGATIDHISGGRFALNVVTGWHKTEIEMFGSPMMEHDKRYDAAAEWLEVIQALWQKDEPLNYDGQFYQVRDALLKPKPIQKPYPAIMCAGASSKGRDFAARHCDITFSNTEKRNNFDDMRAAFDAPRTLAYEKYHRDLKVWSHVYVIVGETEKDAQRQFRHCLEFRDTVAVDNLMRTLGINSQSLSLEGIQKLREDFIVGHAGIPLVGTKEQVVDGFARLTKAGLDGVVISWPNYVEGVHQFQKEVLPLLVQAGLR
jgi:FMNH2-dependent dimethyl sulfone monooxygenase